MAKLKDVVPGAAGYIFSRRIDEFGERYDLVLLDVSRRTRIGADIAVVDLTVRNRDAYRDYFRGADAVLHCAFVERTGGAFTTGNSAAACSQTFQNEFATLQMHFNVFQTAVEERVRRALVYSSNHAADWYERLI